MGSELIVTVVMEPFDRRVLDRAVPLPGNGLLANREREPFDLGATQENSPLDCFLIFAALWGGLVSRCSMPPRHGFSNQWRNHGSTSQIMSKRIGRE